MDRLGYSRRRLCFAHSAWFLLTMITVISGVPGAGKSYMAVKLLLQHLSDGKEVWTNLRGLNLDQLKGSHRIHLMSDSELSAPWDHLPNDAVLIFDEVLEYFSRLTLGSHVGRNVSPVLLRLEEWLRMHRHSGQLIYFVAQDMRLLTQPIRMYCSDVIWLENLGHFGFSSSYREKRYSNCDNALRNRTPYAENDHRYDKEVFLLYNSVDAGASVTSKVGRNIFTRPIVLLPVLVFLAVLVFGINNFSEKFETPDAVASPVSAPILVSAPIPDSAKSEVVTEPVPQVARKSNEVDASTPSAAPPLSESVLVGLTFMKEKCFAFIDDGRKARLVRVFERPDWMCSGSTLIVILNDKPEPFHVGDSVPF